MSLNPELRFYSLIAITALLVWAWAQWQQQQPASETTVTADNPDFYSTGYSKRELDNDGLVINHLQADRMQHFAADGHTALVKPVMQLFSASRLSPWVIQADSGIMAADGDRLQLQGTAVISRQASAGVKALTINTTDLTVSLLKHFATTSAPATIISPPQQTTGTGMEVTFINPIHLTLLDKVKGRYVLTKK
jgi:lipopolysaccharide export system protein LptC